MNNATDTQLLEELSDALLAEVSGGAPGDDGKPFVNDQGQLVGPVLKPLPPNPNDARTLIFFD